MTQDEIIRMAREARLAEPYHPYNPWSASQEGLERFAALVAAHERNRHAWTQEHWTEYEHAIATAEREACAKLCLETDAHPDHGDVAGDFLAGHIWGCEDCAAAIRSRCSPPSEKT